MNQNKLSLAVSILTEFNKILKEIEELYMGTRIVIYIPDTKEPRKL